MDPERILQGLVMLVVFVFSVVVHENAHGLAAERYGDLTARMMGRITMNPLPHVDPVGSLILPILAFYYGLPFIGWAKPVPVNSANLKNPMVHNAYVAAAGPASNLLLAVGAAILYALVLSIFKHVPALHDGGGNSLRFFVLLFELTIIVNCVLAIFNLLPIPPLDGHWILFRYLPPRYGQILMAIRPYGFFILIGLLWTGVLRLILAVPHEFLAGGLIGLARKTGLSL